jgi:hypothetical protein
MIFFLRTFSLFCAVALLLAFAGDVLFLVATRISGGGAGLLMKPPAWIGLFFIAWIAAFAIGVFIASKLHIFPFGFRLFPFVFKG